MKIKRAANFTSEEKDELLETVLKYRKVLFGKVTMDNDWPHKNAAWNKVLNAVNSVSFVQRSLFDIRRKLKDLKAATRKKYMDANGSWKSSEEIKDATTEECKILTLLGNEDVMDKVEVKEEQIDDEDVKFETLRRASQTKHRKQLLPEELSSPLKKIKLIMKNVPANILACVSSVSSSIPASSPPIPLLPPEEQAVCACTSSDHDHLQDAAAQTDDPNLPEGDPQVLALTSIIETQRMIAKALSGIEQILNRK